MLQSASLNSSGGSGIYIGCLNVEVEMEKKKEKATALYQLKVILEDSQPPIWRKFLVEDNIPLDQLHDVLQFAMGWEDYHLHEYRVGDKFIGMPDPEGMVETIDEQTLSLKDIVSKPKDKFIYDYDFGDGWSHTVTLEKILPLDFSKSPIVVAGKGACPPEDCGGMGGYYSLLEAIEDPNHEEYEMLRDWLGGDFDPDVFSIDETNEFLAGLKVEFEDDADD